MAILLMGGLFVQLSAQPAAKKPFTFEDMMSLKRIGGPVISPDGKWVLFSAVDVDLNENKRTSHLWVVSVAGGIERQERLAPLPTPLLHQAQIEAIFARHEADEARMRTERVMIEREHAAFGYVVALNKTFKRRAADLTFP